jgi:phosphatidylethanolamine/phosphatidyl-N-methylethanolamine N-methyltransferase
MPRKVESRRDLARKAPLEFFKGFLRNPKEVGSIIPSSRFMTKRIMKFGEVDRSRVIVELGPGTGVLTGEILKRMMPEAKLVAVEINQDFVDVLRGVYPDPRLSLHTGVAADLEKALERAGETKADLVLSGIPFSTLERGEGRRTLEATRRVLAPGGRFVAYQFRSAVKRMGEPVFGRAEVHPHFLNLPPMRIYVWRQPELS